MSAAASSPQHKVRGRPFRKGQCANPAGKKKGTKNRLTILAESIMEADAAAVIRKVVEKAKAGDMRAARLILERVSPPRKGCPIEFELPPLRAPSDLIAAISAILEATSKGEITPDEAAVVATVLDAKRRAIETLQLEARLKALEERSQNHAA